MEIDKFEYTGFLCKRKRKSMKITRKKASELSGISESWIQKFENSSHRNFEPTLTKIEKYCNFLNMKLEITVRVYDI